MNITCPKCKSILDLDSAFEGKAITCPVCANRFEANGSGPTIKVISRGDGESRQSSDNDLAGKFAEVMGVMKPKGFKWKEFFSEVFKKHTKKEIESYFTVGTSETTPDIFGVSTEWPKPWMFARCLVGCIILYLTVYCGVRWFGLKLMSNVTDLIIIGSFAVPISLALLFFEINVRRNVSLYEFVRFLFFGGIVSMYLLLPLGPLNSFIVGLLPQEWNAISAGPVEEVAKLIAVLFLARGRNYRYVHNGLLFGAAVGAGFAMFESAGYAFVNLLAQKDFSAMNSNILSRAFFAPVGHVAYSAIWAGALWRVKGDKSFEFSMLCDWRFLKLFLLGILLHVFWNSPLLAAQFGEDGSWYAKMVIVGIVAWFVIFSLVQEGLEQIRKEQKDILSS